MAEERIEIPVTPERAKATDGNLRRHSTGRTSTSNSGEKILSRYLRASTSSCHDFCKYGRRHAFEEKGNHSILKGFTATLAEDQNLVQCVTLAERKKKPVVKPKPSPDPKSQEPDTPNSIKRGAKIIKQEASSPAKKMDVAAKPAVALKPKPVAAKSSYSALNTSRGLTGRRNTNVKIVKNTGTSKIGEKKALVPPTDSLSPKPSVNRVASLNTRKYGILKAATLKNQNKVRKAEPEKPCDEKVGEKTLYIIEPKTENKITGPTQNGSCTSLSSPSSSSSSSIPSSETSLPLLSLHEEEEHIESESTLGEENDTVSEHHEPEIKNHMETLKGENNRRLRTAMVHPEDKEPTRKLNFRRGKVVNLLSENNVPRRIRFRQGRVLVDNQNCKGDLGKGSFRRREVDDGDTNNAKPVSDGDTLHEEEEHIESELTLGEDNNLISEHDETEKKNPIETSKGEYKRGLRTAMVHPEDKDPPWKLNFSRGKVVDLQSENNGPRRLRFRKGRVIGDNQNSKGDLGRRSFRRRELDDDDTNGAKQESDKVVLRHQDVRGKKDAQGLFNNVIEETASKLVETRKSKVKALVGAFETVISLQESKPSATSIG